MNRKKISTRDLSGAAIFTALSVIMTRFLSLQLTPELRIGFGPLPLIITGIMYGPVLGGIAGFVADIVGMMINPMGGAFHPGFSLSSVLTGLIPGLVMMAFMKKNIKGSKSTLNKVMLISVLLVYGIVHLFINSYWISNFSPNAYDVLVKLRAPKVAIEALVCFILLKLVVEQVLLRYDKSLLNENR